MSTMLFNGVSYAISPTLPAQRQNELAKLLDANGAAMVEFSEATRVISNTLQFEGRESLGGDCQIITDEWVDRSIVQGRLQETKYFSADPIMIFSGVVACVADLEPCDTEVIAAGINALGGLFREGYTRDCTHVLATRPDSDKYLTAMHYASATRVKVVLPHWFDDCFKLLVRLPEDPYLWPDPPLLRTNYALSKARLAPPTKALVKAAVLEDEPAEKIATLGKSDTNIWSGKRILLSSMLNLANGRREAVEAAVQRAGGVIVQSSGDEAADVEDADVYVTLHRFGIAFVKAIRANKLVGTLSWLFNVHKSGILTSPLDQLLHFPTPRPPLPGFEKHKITATNYEGDARRYLKKLIELMGAAFTPQMTAQNTAVVAAYIKGEKSAKAREWNIPIVNHMWLEDCFASWTLITPAQEKYVSFPPGVNFGDLVCKRHVTPLSEEELEEIERASLEVEAQERKEREEALEAERKKVEAEKEAERLASKSSQPHGSEKSPAKTTGKQARSSQESNQPTPLKPAAARLNAQRPVQRHEEEEEEDEKDDSQPPRKPRGRPQKRMKESEEESEVETRAKAGRGRGKARVSPTKRTMSTRSRARSDVESEEEDEDVPRRPARSAQNTPSGKSSPVKSSARTRVIHVEDDSDEEEHPHRTVDKSNKSGSAKEKEGSSNKRVEVATPAKGAKGKSTSVLELMNDDEFASSSDESLSPIVRSKRTIAKQAASKSKGGKSKRRATQFEEEEEEEEVEEVEEEVAPRTKSSKRNTVAGPSKTSTSTPQEPKTPIRKHASLPGPTPGKTVFVEIPSPAKSSSQRSAAASASHTSPKRGRPAAPKRTSRKHDDDDDQENEPSPSPRGSPAESPSRSSRFSDAAVRRSSKPTPIISSTNYLRTPSKRQAASKATVKLHEDALDIIKFEKQKRSGRFRGAWEDGTEKAKAQQRKEEESKKRRGSAAHGESDEEESSVRSKKKRKSDDIEDDKGHRDVGKKPKKPRISTSVSGDEVEGDHASEDKSEEAPWYETEEIHLMTTQVMLSDQVLKGLQRLGVKMASRPTECNLLVANTIGRTEKFLCAMATAHAIVTEAWAIESVNAKRILQPEDFFLKDPEGEKKHKFKLADALRRAQSSDKKLLEGHTFYLTKSLHRSEKLNTYKNVIHSAGGKTQLANPTVRILKGHEDRHVLSVEADRSITDPLADEGFHIYVPEFILVGILTQRMDWDDTPHRLDKN